MEQEGTYMQTDPDEQMIQQAYQALVDGYLNSNHRKKVEIIDRAFACSGHNSVAGDWSWVDFHFRSIAP